MCDTMVSVTPGGVLFAKNSDRDPNEAQVPRWEPAADHPAGSTVTCTWIAIPQVAHTHAVLLSQPWWMWGAEVGANEHGVVIGNEAVFTDQPLGDPALLGMDLLRLGLERADSAERAVSVIIDLLERHGQGGPCSHERPGFSYHNSYLVADRSGAFVLETAGRLWATERVERGGRSISNGLTIRGFAEAHADRRRGRIAGCALRRGRTEAAAVAAVGPADLMAALRDHGPGPVPRYSPVNGALSAPCAHAGGLVTSTQTTASWVADLRGVPTHWLTASAAPCTGLFAPVGFAELEAAGLPDLGASPTNRHDPTSHWWRHERLHRAVAADHGALLPRYRAERDRVEAAWLADPPAAADAFARAGELDERWWRDVAAARARDTRPIWVRRRWRELDRAAGLPEVAA